MQLYLILLNLISVFAINLCCNGSEISYEYDECELIAHAHDPRGIDIQYTYNAAQQLAEKIYSTGKTVKFSYYSDGSRQCMEDERGLTLYEYNEFGKPLKIIFPQGKTLEYTYDSEGNRTQILYPDGSSVNYTYDTANRLINIRDSSGLTQLEYDEFTGYVYKKIFPNGSLTEFHYTSTGQVHHTIHKNNHGKLIQEFIYTFDARGNRTKVKTITANQEKEVIYTYDKLNRVKRAEYSDRFFEAFTYDGSGNRLTKTTPSGTILYKYNGKNQLIQAGDIAFSYDRAGNLIEKTSPELHVKYRYDEEGRLISCITDLHQVDFEYDGDGIRIAKTVDGVRTEYINDVATPLQQVLMEQTGAQTIRYTYAGSRLNRTSRGHSDFYLYDSPSRNISGMITDHGKLRASYDYSVFGSNITETLDDNSFKYCGEYIDKETGLIYLKNRYYDPDLGRFITMDRALGQLEHPQTLNPYVYVNNNPVNFVDPFGLAALEPEKWEKVILHINDMGGWFGGQGAGGHVFLEFLGRGFFLGNYPEEFKFDEAKNINKNTTSFECFCQSDKVSEAISVMRKIEWTAAKNCVYTAVEGMKVMGFAHADKIKLSKVCPLPSELRGQMLELTGNSSHIADYPRRVVIQCDVSQDNPLSAAINLDYGGVSLNKSAVLDTPLTDIIGATVDSATGHLILYGANNVEFPPFNLDDLTVAIQSIYGLSEKPAQDPGVSIGTEPSPIPGQMMVRYDGATFGTAFGRVMFEADRLLKCLTLGKDNLSGEPFDSHVPGYISLHDRLAREQFSGELINQMWFVPGRVSLALADDGKSLLFSDVQMLLLTEAQFTGQGNDPEASQAFAEHFNAHFDEFADEFPILQELKTLGKMTAIVKWLKEQMIPFDTKLFAEHQLQPCFTPDLTPATEIVTDEYSPISPKLLKKIRDPKHLPVHPIKSLKTVGGIVYHLDEHNFYTHENSLAKAFAFSALDARPEDHASAWSFTSPHSREDLIAISQALYHTKKPGNVRKSFIDIQIPVKGNFSLSLTRFYNSFYEGISGFGFGWRLTPFELQLPIGKVEALSFFGPIRTYPALIIRGPEGEEIYTPFNIDQEGNTLFTNRSHSLWIKNNFDGSFTFNEHNMTIEFDEKGRMTKIADVQGFSLNYKYENDRLVEILSSNQEKIVLKYEGERIAKATGPHGACVEYRYHADGQLAEMIDSKGKTFYEYDESKRLSHLYDNGHNPIFEAVYDPYHRASFFCEEGISYSTNFSLAKREMRIKTSPNQETLLRFDEENRLIFKQKPSGRSWEFKYEDKYALLPNKIIENNSSITECRYDSSSRLIYFKNPLGGVWRFFYDGAGNLMAESSPSGASFLHFYDNLNRRKLSYLKVDLAFDQEDPSSPLKGFTIASGYTLTYTYDPDTGKLASITNTRGGTTTFTYDGSGQLSEITSPLGQTFHTDLDVLGNWLGSKTCNVMQTSMTYDEKGFPNTLHTPNGDITFVYDANSDLVEIKQPLEVHTAYAYDLRHNLVEVTDAEGGITKFTYNEQNQLTDLHLPNGTVKKLEYDHLGRLYKEIWLNSH